MCVLHVYTVCVLRVVMWVLRVCWVLRTLVFVLHRVVDIVDSFLQLIPGQWIFSCLLLQSELILKVSEHNDIMIIIRQV